MISQEFTQKTVVVFGGTSGIGLAISRGFRRAGAQVFLLGRNQTQLETLIQEFELDLPPATLTADVSKPDTIAAALQVIQKKTGTIHHVVNSSGAHVKVPSEKMTYDQWDLILNTNLKGAFAVSREAFPFLCDQPEVTSITHISSINGTVAFPDTAAYCVSKAGLNMLTHSLARDWASRKIRVNAIAPGVIPTSLNEKALADPDRAQKILAKIPMARLGNLKDIVGTALFLASPAAAYVTGAVVPVDGGFLSNGL